MHGAMQFLWSNQMDAEKRSTLDVIYENWAGYNARLDRCVAPLTDAQLQLKPAAHHWPVGRIVQHIVSARAGWFSGTLQDADAAMESYMDWGERDSPHRNAADLVRGLDDTWEFIESRLKSWTPEDFARTFPDEMDGQTYEVSRSWVMYHVLEHDLHHGSEVSLILGMNGLQPIEI
jgi:uncharacterized damage-inducible protein DinB